MTPRARQKKETSALADALKFVAIAQRDIGTPYQTHTILAGGWAIAYDGVLAAGTPINEDVDARPNTKLFIEALTKCGANYSIIREDADKITVRTDRFKAIVPCVLPELLTHVAADPVCAPLGDDFKAALEAVAFLASDTAQHVVTASVLARRGSCVATDRRVILECWHPYDLPPMQLPKQAVSAICKADKPLTGFGFGGSTATFHFDDGSWIRTSLMEGEPVDFNRVLDVRSNPWPLPPHFFEGVRAVAGFNNDTVIFGDKQLRSHQNENVGATFDVSGIPREPIFNAKVLLSCEQFMRSVDFVGVNRIAYFFDGEKIRGAITGIVPAYEAPPPPTPEEQAAIEQREAKRKAQRLAEQALKPWHPGMSSASHFYQSEMDDDIPF